MRTFFLKAVAATMAVMAMLFSVPVRAQTAPEEIAAFNADLTVQKDGTLSVVERIEYVFPTERHGIYRDVPVRYSIDGRTVRMPIEVQEVTMDGATIPFEVTDNKNIIRVRIGDPDATVSGQHSYSISYVVRGALRYFPDHDELYWNVTGNTWTVPIRRVSATVHAPEGAAGRVTHACYTGEIGSTAQDCLARAEGTTVSYVAEGPLTVVVGWPHGLTAELLPVVDDWFSPMKLWPLLLPFVAGYFLYRRWSRTGRDPKGRGTTMVQYDPPEGLGPAETGGLVDERSGAAEVVATIVDLAVHGHVKFVEAEKKGLFGTSTTLRLDRTSDDAAVAVLRPHERTVMDALFGVARTTSLDDVMQNYAFDGKVAVISRQIDTALIGAGYFPKNMRTTPGAYIVTGIVLAIAGVWLGFSMAAAGGWSASVAFGIALVLTGIMVAVSGKAMVQWTEKGVLGREHAEGFKEYLEKAEKYRLQWQEKEGIFEKFLPYAMVFGVADKWMKAFEGFDLKKPDWYEGPSLHGSRFNAAVLAGAMSQMQKATVSAVMATKPAQSSSGSGFSGGSSGGGGGGGGGGSW